MQTVNRTRIRYRISGAGLQADCTWCLHTGSAEKSRTDRTSSSLRACRQSLETNSALLIRWLRGSNARTWRRLASGSICKTAYSMISSVVHSRSRVFETGSTCLKATRTLGVTLGHLVISGTFCEVDIAGLFAQHHQDCELQFRTWSIQLQRGVIGTAGSLTVCSDPLLRTKEHVSSSNARGQEEERPAQTLPLRIAT